MQEEDLENGRIDDRANSTSANSLAAEALSELENWKPDQLAVNTEGLLPDVFIDEEPLEDRDVGMAPEEPEDQDRNRVGQTVNESEAEKAPLVKVELGADFSEVRSFVANGHRVKIKSLPDFKRDGSPYTHSIREVTIDGKQVKLMATAQQWFYSRMANGLAGEPENMPKIHIKVDSPADLAKVQASVIPVLEKLIDREKVKLYKTYDPNFADKEWSDTTAKSKPGPDVQGSKGFTVYLPKEHAVEVAGILDRALTSQDLSMQFRSDGSVGDTWRKHTTSARVSMERANWEFVEPGPNSNRILHLLDTTVEKELSKQFAKYQENGRMKPEGLAAIEKAAGVEPGKLVVDPGTGRIALVSRIARGEKGSSYVDESQANKEPGSRTGRPAMYALHELAGIDPVLAELGTPPDRRSNKEVPNIINKENINQARRVVELNIMDVLEATYTKLAHGKSKAEQEQGRELLKSLSKSEDPHVREMAVQMELATAAADRMRATGQEPRTFRELMQEKQYGLEKAQTGKKVLVGVGLGVGLGTTVAVGLNWINSNRKEVAPIRDAAPKTQKK